MSRIAVTGSSGLIGTALVAALRERGDEVVRLVRRAAAVGRRGAVGPLDPRTSTRACSTASTAVVNLAGAGVGDQRWTPAYKHEILASRIDCTHRGRHGGRRGRPPGAARRPGRPSATTATGATRSSPRPARPGTGFLADVVLAWEAADPAGRGCRGLRRAASAPASCSPAEGGAMKPLLLLGRFGLGGPLGYGRQFCPGSPCRRGRRDPAPARPPGRHRAGQPLRARPGAPARHRRGPGSGAAPARRAAGAVVRAARRARRVRRRDPRRPAHRG